MNVSPFSLRGVVEGFYGTFYTFPQRNDMIRFLGENNFNFYLYGPKNDRQHRGRWREPYPTRILDAFKSTVRIARDSGVTFCYAISFGAPVQESYEETIELVMLKLRAFSELGCDSFAIFLDDMDKDFIPVKQESADTPGQAHARFSNDIYDQLLRLSSMASLSLCPTDYHGTAPFSDYVHELGETLNPEIGVLYTGPDVCSARISSSEVEAFARAVKRRPIIWDNYPVNDLGARHELHLGPLEGRDPALPSHCDGIVFNVMIQAAASQISLLTASEYLYDPKSYDAQAAWARALCMIAGREDVEALTTFAENSLASCLSDHEAPRLTLLAQAAVEGLKKGNDPAESRPVAELARYLDKLDESSYHLRTHLQNLAVRQDLLPWIEALDEKMWLARSALAAVSADHHGLNWRPGVASLRSQWAEVVRNPRRIGGSGLEELAQFALGSIGLPNLSSDDPFGHPEVPPPMALQPANADLEIAG